MKISISFPPIESKKGAPLLTQNRQFQWFNSPTYIYPVIPAYAATLLKQSGFEVFWDDGIAEGLSYQTWLDRIIREKPDIIAIETKTPVIKRHWEIINELKACPVKSGETGISQGAELFNRVNKVESWKPKIVLMGDHATAFPEESMKNSKADFAIAGGDFDFILLSICKGLKKDETGNWKLEAGNLEGGVWRQESGKIKNSGIYDLRKHSLDELPMIDRELTKWKLYGYKNGNFKYTPGAYMMSARDCWWGRCSFCAWTVMFPGKNFRARSAKKALDEVGYLIDLGVKEIMEDSGSLPIGRWLEEFCNGMIERGYDKKVATSCNMRINGIRRPEIWKLMKRAGFRFILFGLESANQITLDKINKNLKVEEIEPGLKMCKEAGLEPHITAMIGYPWETKKMARKTVDLAKSLFNHSVAKFLKPPSNGQTSRIFHNFFYP
ncbi:radical SAM protein, partial [Patescibacteria group bacterium]|nr:radical SAM protein [Patescibacteria group bacterium]